MKTIGKWVEQGFSPGFEGKVRRALAPEVMPTRTSVAKAGKKRISTAGLRACSTPLEAKALLIITGSMGSGKTTVMAEASDILAARGISHAAIDLDALGMVHLFPSPDHSDVAERNFRCVCENYAALGVTRLLVARAVETPEELASYCAAAGAVKAVVCRLTASSKTMEQRIRMRETGMWQQKFVDRVRVLNALLDRAQLEDFCVTNENRSVTEAAQEMLVRAGWL